MDDTDKIRLLQQATHIVPEVDRLNDLVPFIIIGLFVFLFGVLPILAVSRKCWILLCLYAYVMSRLHPDILEYGVPLLLHPPVLILSLLIAYKLSRLIDYFSALAQTT